MSSVIDEDLFDALRFIYSPAQSISEELKLTINRIGKLNEETILLLKNQAFVETLSKLRFQHWQYGVRSKAFRVGPFVRTVAYLLDSRQYWRCRSRHHQILFMKQLVRRRREGMAESTIIIEDGRIGLIMNHFLMPPGSSSVRWVSAYHRIVLRNVMSFEQFLHKQLRIPKKGRPLEEAFPDRNRNLLISQILNTTQTTEEIYEDKSQFQFANKSLEKQNYYLNLVEHNIVPSREIQKTVGSLFMKLPSNIQSQSLRTNIINSYQESSLMFKSILKLKYPPKKKIQDYLYNKVKAEIIEDALNGRLVGSGGSCVINQYHMNLTFIGSHDSSDLSINESLQERVEKIVAVKKLKPGYTPKVDKIAHQKKIVNKLRSSVTYFIPKYYEIDRPQLKNCILMERIIGDQLDFYMQLRGQTISFWSKLNLMVNVIHGLRHLISYGIVHLDLKPINILVSKSFITKIIDFGESYHPDICPKNYIPAITFPYAAPEVYSHYLKQLTHQQSHLAFSQKQDVFALGIIMAEVIFGDSLFHISRQKCMEVYSKQSPLQRVFYAVERNELFGDDLLLSVIGFLIIRCLDGDPERRPRVEWIGIILKLMLNSYGSPI